MSSKSWDTSQAFRVLKVSIQKVTAPVGLWTQCQSHKVDVVMKHMPLGSPEVPVSIPRGGAAPGRPLQRGPRGLLVGPVPASPWDSRTCAQGWDYAVPAGHVHSWGDLRWLCTWWLVKSLLYCHVKVIVIFISPAFPEGKLFLFVCVYMYRYYVYMYIERKYSL